MQEFTNITTISNPFLSLFLIILCTTYTVDITFAGDTLLKTACSNTSYAANSSYEASVNVLFSSLATNATQGLGKTRFFNTTVVGYDHGSSYTVYGLYLCRGDDSNNDCKTCVPKAIESLQQECATRPVVATVWYVIDPLLCCNILILFNSYIAKCQSGKIILIEAMFCSPYFPLYQEK